MSKLHLDFETFSSTPIKYGAHRYVESPDFEILCMAWAIDDYPVELWTPDEDVPKEFIAHIANGRPVCAHNAAFEYNVWNSYAIRSPQFPLLGPEQMRCSAARAASLSLPRALGKVSQVLGLTEKDTEGHRVMLKLSKPRKPTKNNPDTRWYPETAPVDFAVLYDYCKNDVVVEREIEQKLGPLSPEEQKLWVQDLKINNRGLQVDLKNVDAAIETWGRYTAHLIAECQEICGCNPRQTEGIRQWLDDSMLTDVPNVQAATLDALLETELPADIRTVVQARRYTSATSVSKYKAIQNSACSDGRIRGMFLYHGANTGRWAGKIVQMHNLPRGILKNPEEVVDGIPALDMIYGDKTPAVMSSLIRPMFMASPGKTLAVADYSSIEARGVCWLAGDEEALEIFREGKDIYKDMASDIYQVGYDEVNKDQRAVGKQAILGLGYNMGWKKFQETCGKYGIEIDASFAKRVVDTYRNIHDDIPKLWRRLEFTAKKAIVHPGEKFTTANGRVAFFMEDRYLFMQLPSGRLLAYPEATLIMKETSWGKEKPTIRFWGADSQTQQWCKQYTYGGKLCENITQAFSRDILANALMKYDDVVIHVHDEIVREVDPEGFDLKKFEKEICVAPAWAKGLPLEAEGFLSERYKK